MSKAAKWIIAAAAFVVVIVGIYCLYDNLNRNFAPDQLADGQDFLQSTDSGTGSSGTEEPANPVPDFTVLDVHGNEVSLSEYFGKPIILNFWASWCYYCDLEMPHFNDAYLTYADEIEFLMVNVTDGSRETIESATEYIADAGFEFPVYFDTTLMAAMSYGASGLPMTFFIDENGSLVTYAAGMLTTDNLARGIEMLLPSEE